MNTPLRERGLVLAQGKERRLRPNAPVRTKYAVRPLYVADLTDMTPRLQWARGSSLQVEGMSGCRRVKTFE